MKGVITDEDWDKWKNDISVDFLRDNHFAELKNTEIMRERLQTLDTVRDYVGEYFSKEWVMKNVLQFTDEDIKTMGVGSDSGDDEQDGKEDDSEE